MSSGATGRRVSATVAAMIDHIAVQCADVERSRAFYAELLGALGFSQFPYGAPAVGFGSAAGPFFWLGPGSSAETRELHVAFRAADREQVREFHRRAVALGAEVLHEPREFPEYHPGYYGVFVRDPDGHNVEAVCHATEK